MKTFALIVSLLIASPLSASAQCLDIATAASPTLAIAQPQFAPLLAAPTPLVVSSQFDFGSSILAVPHQSFVSFPLIPLSSPAVVLQPQAIQRVRVSRCRIRPSLRSRSVLRIRSSCR